MVMALYGRMRVCHLLKCIGAEAFCLAHSPSSLRECEDLVPPLPSPADLSRCCGIPPVRAPAALKTSQAMRDDAPKRENKLQDTLVQHNST